MTNPAFNPEDPRLTAFVLGEIDDSDRAEIEQLLEASPEAQAAVKEIEETIGVLKEGLASEPTPELTAEHRATVEEQLVSPTGSPTGSVPQRRALTGFHKVVGAVASVAALGLVATYILPSANHAARVASDEVAATSASELLAMNDASEMEESFTAEGESRIRVMDMVGPAPASTEPTDNWSRVEAAAQVSGLNEAVSRQVTARSGKTASANGYSGRNQSGGYPAAPSADDSGRVESDFAKRDMAQAGVAGKATSFSSVSRPKDVSRTDAPQQLIADTGSRPGRDNRQVKVSSALEGRALPVPSQPTVATAAKSASDPQSTSVDRLSQVGKPTAEAPASGGRGTTKGKFANPISDAAGGKSVNGPESRSMRKTQLVAGNAQPAKPQSPVGGGVSVSPAPANAVALLPGKNESKKEVLSLEGELKKRTVSPGATAQPEAAATPVNRSQLPTPHTRETIVRNKVFVAPGELADPYKSNEKSGSGKPDLTEGLVSTDADRLGGALKTEASKLQQEGEELKRVADKGKEVALIKGKRIERLAELVRLEQVQLAAIDSGTTRRVLTRGFGLEGRDLEEQLQKYSVDLGLKISNHERMPEARQSGGFGNEYYAPIVENNFIVPVIGDKEKSLSTISVDVDTASYANMRRFLNRDQLPPADSVRIEELVNYFKYNYPEPEGDEPFSVKTELAMCPWQSSHRLAMVGLKAKTIEKAQRPPTNLVFLLDVSGSMRASNKLPLVQQSMRLLVEEMTEDDRVSIVTYASNAGVRLGSTLGSKKQEILAAINGLRAGGSTNGEGGIRMAYDEANRHYFQGGANRVILCSDGDFNVGKSSDGELVELIQEKAASGVFLSVFGFGMGNLKDAKLEKLADKGNGHYGYIDNLNEAKKVFQDELVGTLYTVAKDVKLQVEFNPATVGAYRLLGYENRKLAAQDFTDDTKDAGEIGSGHTVTALYEIIPKQVLLSEPEVDGLKYQATAKKPVNEGAKETVDADSALDSADPVDVQPSDQELLTVKLRYKKPDEEVSQPVFQDFVVKDVSIAGKQLSVVSDDLMFAASVASFGMNLRGSKYRGNWGFAEALETAQGAQGDGNDTQRTEFIQLVQRAMRITGQQTGPQPRTSQGTTTRPGELGATEARVKASVSGKYRRLVKKIEVQDDFQRFGAFNDYGHWDGAEYSGHKDLPPGNWVYVYPNWYIWAEAIVPLVEDKPAVESAEPRSGEEKPATENPAVK